MHHPLNLWKKAVPTESRDLPNAICLFHTRPQESRVVMFGGGLVCPEVDVVPPLLSLFQDWQLKITYVLGTVGVSLRSFS